MKIKINTTLDFVEEISKSLNTEKSSKNLESYSNKTSEKHSFKNVLDIKKTESILRKDKRETKLTNKDNSIEDTEEITDEEAINILQDIIQIIEKSLNFNEDINLNNSKTELKIETLGIEVVENLFEKNVFQSIGNLRNNIHTTNNISKEAITALDNFLENSDLMESLDEKVIANIETLLKNLQIDGNLKETSMTKEVLKELQGIVKEMDNSQETEEIDMNLFKANVNISEESKFYESNTGEKNFEGKEESKETIKKEDKLLKSIIEEDSVENVTNKFTVFNERITTNTSVKVSAEEIIINKDNVVQDVVKSIKYIENNNIKELTVNINPKELGEISIKLIQQDGLMKTNIKANSKETYELLSQHLNDIKKVLGEQNIKVSEVNISLYNEDTTFFKNEEFSNNFFNGEQKNNSSRDNSTYTEREENLEDSINEAEDLRNINMLA